MLTKLKKNYHWIIAAIALVQLLVYGGAINNYSGYHMIPVTEALAISRTAFSLANSLRSIMALFSTLLSGLLIRRFGSRRTVAAGMALAGFSYMLYTFMDAYWMLLLGSALLGLTNGFCYTAAVSQLINVWFHKFRGTVLGLVTAATGVGSTLLGFAQTAAIEHVSWRLSFAIVAGLQLGIALLVYLFVRSTPQEMDLLPYGDGQADVKEKKKNKAVWQGFPMSSLKRQPAFYLLLLCAFFSTACVLATQYNLVPYLQDCGMSATQTGGIYGTMMLFLGIIKLGLGSLSDAIGAKKVALLCHIACASGLFLIMSLPQTNAAMIGAMIVYDFSIPLTTMMFPLLSVELFGWQAQSQYIAIIMAMTSASGILSSPIANFVRDTLGSYRPVFWACIITSVCLLGLYCLLYALVSRSKRQFDAKEEE